MSAALPGAFKERLNLFWGSLTQILALRQYARREFGQDVVVELLQIIESHFHALIGLFRVGKGRLSDHAFRIDNTFNAAAPHCAVTWNRIAINVTTPVQMSRRQESPGSVVLRIFEFAHLRKEGHREGGFCFTGVMEGVVVWSAVGLIHKRLTHDTRYVHENDHSGHLVVLAKFVDSRWNNIFLTVEAYQDLFPEFSVFQKPAIMALR